MAAAGKPLRLVHSARAGVDKIDVAALPAGTVVANTFHHEDSIAEYVIAATVLLRRGFLAQDAALRRGEWASPAYDPSAFILAAQGAVAVQMSYFPELFGNRYRNAGVTLGREFSSVLGGGVAPLICAALVAAVAGSWVPVAVYMMGMALISLIATRLAPETLDRDLTTPVDAWTPPSRRGRTWPSADAGHPLTPRHAAAGRGRP